jgi:N-acetylglucosamine transport system substrate-binding protein
MRISLISNPKQRACILRAAITMAVVAAMTATGCSRKTYVPPEDVQGESQPPAEPTAELNLAVSESGFNAQYWNEIVKRYEEVHSEVKVNLQISTSIEDVIRPQIEAGNVPDLLCLNDSDQDGVALSLIRENRLLEITDVFDGPQYDSGEPLRTKIINGVLESVKCAPYGDDRIYLAPLNAGPIGLVYNKALFAENGWEPPVTWEDFFALGDEAKKNGIALLTYQGVYPGYLESFLFPAIASAAGPDALLRIMRYQEGSFNNPEVLTVLENFKKIADGGYLMNGAVTMDITQSQLDQMNNKALFIPNGAWMENEMAEAARADGYAFAMAPPPVLNAGGTRYIMSSVEQASIPLDAKNADIAKDFLRFLYTDDSVRLYAETTTTGVLAVKNAAALVKGLIPEGLANMHAVYDEPDAAALIVRFDPLPDDSHIEISEEIFNPVSDVMTGKKTAAQWAESVEAAFQRVREETQ